MSAERRVCPRFHWKFPVQIELESGGKIRRFDSHSINVSRQAIEIAGDGRIMGAFLAQRAYPRLCTLRFELPELEGSFQIECQLSTHRRLSQHRFQLVLLLSGLSGEEKERFAEHLLQQPIGHERHALPQSLHYR